MTYWRRLFKPKNLFVSFNKNSRQLNKNFLKKCLERAIGAEPPDQSFFRNSLKQSQKLHLTYFPIGDLFIIIRTIFQT